MLISKFLIFVLIVSAVLFIENSYASFGDITLTPPKTVGYDGKALNSINTGEPVGFSSVLTNHAKSEQKFTYLVQILNKDGGTDYLEGLSASLLPNQSFTASQSWIPREAGKYTVQVFVWESLASPMPLTQVIKTQITVQ